uniref:Peptidase_M1 domain-containing protein n=1 Tax=Parastrongyloides trichosuri TaxID=131310 RepID=A0A0N4Z7Q7_PARTI
MNRGKRNIFSIASVVVHEIGHQWFGNIVTMNWWNELWLKERFASYIEYEISMKSYPELNVKIHQLCNIFYAMGEDAFETTHPMAINDKETFLRICSSISYEKD